MLDVVQDAPRGRPSLSVFQGLSTYSSADDIIPNLFQRHPRVRIVMHIAFHAQRHYALQFKAKRQEHTLRDTNGDVRLDHMQPEFWAECPRELTTNLDPLAVWQNLHHRVAVSV